MFRKGDIIVKVRGARQGATALVVADVSDYDDCVWIDYGHGRQPYDPDVSPLSYCALAEPPEDYEIDET